MKKIILTIILFVLFIGGWFVYKNYFIQDKRTIYESILVDNPEVDDIIFSPLIVSGKARGAWFFEASFQIEILDSNRNEIGVSHVQAQEDWMTTDFVPFTGEIKFNIPDSDNGFLVLAKDNPSGLPENDASIEIPVKFR